MWWHWNIANRRYCVRSHRLHDTNRIPFELRMVIGALKRIAETIVDELIGSTFGLPTHCTLDIHPI